MPNSSPPRPAEPWLCDIFLLILRGYALLFLLNSLSFAEGHVFPAHTLKELPRPLPDPQKTAQQQYLLSVIFSSDRNVTSMSHAWSLVVKLIKYFLKKWVGKKRRGWGGPRNALGSFSTWQILFNSQGALVSLSFGSSTLSADKHQQDLSRRSLKAPALHDFFSLLEPDLESNVYTCRGG